MSILYEYFTPGSGSAYDSAKGTNKFQTFFAESSHDVSLINLRLARSSVYTETLYGVYIYSVDGDSLPDTELVQMGSFYVSDLSTSYGNYQFDDDTYSLTLGVEYAIVLATETETTQSRFSWYTNTE